MPDNGIGKPVFVKKNKTNTVFADRRETMDSDEVHVMSGCLFYGKIFVSLPLYFGKIQIDIYGKFFNETIWYKG